MLCSNYVLFVPLWFKLVAHSLTIPWEQLFVRFYDISIEIADIRIERLTYDGMLWMCVLTV